MPRPSAAAAAGGWRLRPLDRGLEENPAAHAAGLSVFLVAIADASRRTPEAAVEQAEFVQYQE